MQTDCSWHPPPTTPGTDVPHTFSRCAPKVGLRLIWQGQNKSWQLLWCNPSLCHWARQGFYLESTHFHYLQTRELWLKKIQRIKVTSIFCPYVTWSHKTVLIRSLKHHLLSFYPDMFFTHPWQRLYLLRKFKKAKIPWQVQRSNRRHLDWKYSKLVCAQSKTGQFCSRWLKPTRTWLLLWAVHPATSPARDTTQFTHTILNAFYFHNVIIYSWGFYILFVS